MQSGTAYKDLVEESSSIDAPAFDSAVESVTDLARIKTLQTTVVPTMWTASLAAARAYCDAMDELVGLLAKHGLELPGYWHTDRARELDS